MLTLAHRLHDDFSNPEEGGPRPYQRRLEGLRIEICKYKEASGIFTQEELEEKSHTHKRKITSILRKDLEFDTLKRTRSDRCVYNRHNVSHRLR